jgi:hypothetical protein
LEEKEEVIFNFNQGIRRVYMDASKRQWEVFYMLQNDSYRYSTVVQAPTDAHAYRIVEAMIPSCQLAGYKEIR